MAELPAGLTILTAMITPAVLILATGSLLLTTSQRLSRSIDRARKLGAELSSLAGDAPHEERSALLFQLLLIAARRSRLLQRSMVGLYVALGCFIATSIAIGLSEFAHVDAGLFPAILGLGGVILLLLVSGLLIVESAVALRAVSAEMAALVKR